MQALWLDNHLLALDKPGGLLTQPSGGHADSLETQAKAWLKQEFKRPGAVFLEAVHRIDKPVCGVVLFARSSKALSRLNQTIREGKSKKIYHARVEGKVKAASARLENFLIHDDYRARVVSKEYSGARLASLSYIVLETSNASSFLEITLETGRYHQIRIQLAQLGHPILGDHKYGARTLWQKEAIALQHVCLTFPHPVGGKEVTVQSKLKI